MNNYYDLLGINDISQNEYLTNSNLYNQINNIPKSINNVYENIDNKGNMYDLNEGFLRGNMFKNLYDPYKNDQIVNIIPKNETEKLMLNIYKTSFALNDIDLYLDIYPNDGSMIQKYNQYNNQNKMAIAEYESKYGPVTLSSQELNTVPWTWFKTKWPWEGEI